MPAKTEITDSVIKSAVQHDHQEPIDLDGVETLFLKQHYADLPEPMRMKGNFQARYDMQLFVKDR